MIKAKGGEIERDEADKQHSFVLIHYDAILLCESNQDAADIIPRNSAHRQNNDQTARAVRAHHEDFFYVRGAARPGDETKK